MNPIAYLRRLIIRRRVARVVKAYARMRADPMPELQRERFLRELTK